MPSITEKLKLMADWKEIFENLDTSKEIPYPERDYPTDWDSVAIGFALGRGFSQKEAWRFLKHVMSDRRS